MKNSSPCIKPAIEAFFANSLKAVDHLATCFPNENIACGDGGTVDAVPKGCVVFRVDLGTRYVVGWHFATQHAGRSVR